MAPRPTSGPWRNRPTATCGWVPARACTALTASDSSECGQPGGRRFPPSTSPHCWSANPASCGSDTRAAEPPCCGTVKLTNYIDGLPRAPIHQFAQDQEGRIWLTSDAGMAEFSGGEWHAIGNHWSSPPPAGNSLFVARDGTLWVTTSWGKSFRQDGSQLVYLQRGSNRFQDSGEPIPVGAAITQAPDGRLWVSDADRGARQIPEFPLLKDPPPRQSDLSTAWNFRALSLVFDNDGALWGVDRAAGIFRLQLQPRCFGAAQPRALRLRNG